ncbi:MAG TPA: carboxypeptidase-like regulatory domain-containing protein [Terrimicrobiaceae bacterium]
MKRSKIVVAFCFLVLIAVFIWRLKPLPKTKQPATTSDVTSPNASSEAKAANQVIEQVNEIFRAPITFHGKVIDQFGAPVPYADVGYTAADKFNASGSHYTGKSDPDGSFEISGIAGAGLLVGVGKQGYYPVEGKSSGSFAYGMGPDSYRQAAPTRQNPAVFLLHKMGETEPLAHASGRQYKVAKDGQPMEVDLKTGSQVPAGKGDIRFERWANDHARDKRSFGDFRGIFAGL